MKKLTVEQKIELLKLVLEIVKSDVVGVEVDPDNVKALYTTCLDLLQK